MNKEKIYILGAGGHARALAALVNAHGQLSIAGFYDDHFIAGERIEGVPVLGTLEQLPAESWLMLAAGNNTQRKTWFEKFANRIVPQNILHHSVILMGTQEFGKSNFIFPRVTINTQVKTGDNNIINTGALIEHESVIGSHNHISLNAVVAGRVTIGDNCMVGASAVIKDGVKICSNVIVGAGAVVVKDIVEPGTYTGVPAKKIK